MIEKSKTQLARKRLDEALVSALAAVEIDPEAAEGWWQVALCREALGDVKNAIAALRKTVELWPDAENAWAKLGDHLHKQGEIQEAREAFESALAEDPEHLIALNGMAAIYAKNDHDDERENELAVLAKLELLSKLSSIQINRLGILHYREGDMHEAVRCWRLDITEAAYPSQRFNLGLAYASEQVYQPIDAIDMWRLTLRDWPDYAPPHDQINRLSPPLLALANRVQRSEKETLLPEDQWYDRYLNPFQLLNVPEDSDFEDIDTKELQRLRKSLLQEIELEEGVLSWLPELTLDRSRAIGVCEELSDPRKKEWHSHVFTNKPLLEFLSRGAHRHFLLGDEDWCSQTIDAIENDPDFHNWLGRLFAPQYDRVLARAIEDGDLLIVECLLSGRCWVPTAMDDDCYQGARRTLEILALPISTMLESAEERKPEADVIGEILRGHRLVEIANRLPLPLQPFTDGLLENLRGLAVRAYNTHDDAPLALRLIEFARQINRCSIRISDAVKKDLETLNGIIRKERQHEVKLTSASAQQWHITKEHVLKGDVTIKSERVTSVRWGATITTRDSGKAWDFVLGFRSDAGHEVAFQWKSGEGDHKRQTEYFNDLVNAASRYVVPHILRRAHERVVMGGNFVIGPCRVTREGIHYEVKGWIFNSSHFTPWGFVRVLVANGDVLVTDVRQTSKRVVFPLKDTENAPILKTLADIISGTED